MAGPDTFEQPKITGYRQLSEDDVRLINTIKAHAEELGELVARLHELDGVDKRWVGIGATDIQKGLMAWVRAVAKPTTF